MNPNQLASQMISEASQVAINSWNAIKSTAVTEFRGLSQRIVMIARLYAQGEISKAGARRHFKAARYHVIAILAMLTALVEAAAAKIVNAALKVIADAVNAAIGFKLV
ncbi:hypothetical protein [Hoeflea poritis]|uniref:Uncharacterized protein n=1 Tax=Hoeflea poritis TaxID=2993659 RepID=A0ABT4VM93_9HYPH|nr:hypothetical protein [Hoeflea poritis]MDA4845833.1 hypothetical protein [Hoeflea poritis]